MIMLSPMNCILNFIDVGPHAHKIITGKGIVFTLKRYQFHRHHK